MIRTIPLRALCLVLLLAPLLRAEAPATMPALREGDRVAFIGSSSTNIGIWPATVQFLLRTRHPELKLTFSRHSSGGGTFKTGLDNLDKWLGESKPTFVLFNYGGNDSGGGEKGLDAFRANIDTIVERTARTGARYVILTHQPSDSRHKDAKPAAIANRTLYVDAMIKHAQAKGYPLIDIHHPLADMLAAAQKEDAGFTIMKDSIHLNEVGYVAWGTYCYVSLGLGDAVSSATLSADGKVVAAQRCKIENAKLADGVLSFERLDEILPLLPPKQLPPRTTVPLERASQYLLKVNGLAAGKYEVRCEGLPLGVCDAGQLDKGVNLNMLLLDSKQTAPWDALAKELWAGKSLDQVGKTRWKFEIRPAR